MYYLRYSHGGQNLLYLISQAGGGKTFRFSQIAALFLDLKKKEHMVPPTGILATFLLKKRTTDKTIRSFLHLTKFSILFSELLWTKQISEIVQNL